MKIVPAILEKNRSEWLATYRRISPLAPRLQVDVADGSLTQEKTLPLEATLSLIKDSSCQFELHALTINAKRVVEQTLEENCNNLSVLIVHLSALTSTSRETWDKWRALLTPIQLGLALNPADLVAQAQPFLSGCDFLTIMTVVPGKQGGEFLAENLVKIKQVRELGFEGKIEVDGGVNIATLKQVACHKPDYLVVGSALTCAKNPRKVYGQLEKLLLE